MKKTDSFILAGGAIIVIGSLLMLFNVINLPVSQNEISSSEKVNDKVTLIIDYGEGIPKTIIESEFQEGMTALDLLKSATERSNIILEAKTYDIGAFVEAIGNKKNGDEGKYWLYYVNGQMPQISADKEELRTGDEVEFKFEKSPF